VRSAERLFPDGVRTAKMAVTHGKWPRATAILAVVPLLGTAEEGQPGMNPLEINPFSVMTFIVAPAILTNASSVMGLGTSNRFARAIDRTRGLAEQIKSRAYQSEAEGQLRTQQLRSAEHRTQLLVRALTCFYLSVGAFAATSLVSLLGAAFVATGLPVAAWVAVGVALCTGLAGVGGLVCGSALLVWETRKTLAILCEETDFVRNNLVNRE